MLIVIYCVNNFEKWFEFADFFFSHVILKKVFTIVHDFMVWITSRSHVQRKVDLILSSLTVDNGFWNYFYKVVLTSLFPIPSFLRTIKFNCKNWDTLFYERVQ